MTERSDTADVGPCRGRTDFCKEHLTLQMKENTALEAYMNTMCNSCADEFVEFCESVLKRKPNRSVS